MPSFLTYGDNEMIFDKTTMFSDSQSVTGTANSTNVVDLGPVANGLSRDIGKGTGIPILVQVVDSFSGGGSVRVTAQVSDNEAFTAPVTAWESPSVSTTQLKAGYVFVPETVTRYTNKRYMRLRYSVTGTGISGKLTAGITMGNQSNG